jgi:hypothetical protein
MNKSVGDLLYNVAEKLIGYLPSLVGGLVILAFAWLLAWLVKRVVFRLCLVLRLDRMLLRTRWGAGFSKADARYALFNTIGNAAFVVVFLILVDAALSTMRLTTLSGLLQSGVLFIPRLLIALVILGLGVAISNRLTVGVLRGLASEGVPKPTLIARLVKAVLILFFSAMALTELGIAREVVLIGFGTIIVTICVLVILLVALGGRSLIKRILGEEEEREP